MIVVEDGRLIRLQRLAACLPAEGTLS